MRYGLHTIFTSIAAITITGTVTGCASFTPPERPVYMGTDTVSSAQPEQLVGVWLINELNPYPDSKRQHTTIEYLVDGSVIGKLEPLKEQTRALDNMEFELTGSWVLNGDILAHQNVKMDSTSDSKLGAMMSKIINNNSKALSGQANIYEISANRIVMVGSDGAAMEYLRQ